MHPLRYGSVIVHYLVFDKIVYKPPYYKEIMVRKLSGHLTITKDTQKDIAYTCTVYIITLEPFFGQAEDTWFS